MTTKGIAQGGTQGGKEVTTKPDDKKGVKLKTAYGLEYSPHYLHTSRQKKK